MNRRQRAAKANAKKLALALAYNEREARLERARQQRDYVPLSRIEEKAYRQVKSSVQLVQEGCSPIAGKRRETLFNPEQSTGFAPRFEGVFPPTRLPHKK